MDAIKIGCVQVDLADWVDGGEKLLEDEQLRAVVEGFLLKSPSMGMSRMSPGFVHEQRVFTSPSAEALTERLLDGIEHRNFFESADDLERVLAPQLDPCNVLWIEGEFVYQTRTKAEAMSTWLDTSEEIGRANTPGVADGARDIIRRRFYEVDAIYRHLRNALAHGCFKHVKVRGEAGLFYFDINRDGKVSAVAAVTFKRLHEWETLRCQMRNGKLE